VKPVIVSMSSVAGSGGYHIACNGTRILADESTITGSIGVFNIWFHTRGLYEKLGLSREIFTRGDNADIFPSWREVTEKDLELSRYFTDEYYDKFVADVARGRGMEVDRVRAVAQGRVWAGRSAVEIGLVDRIGGLGDAIELAKKDAGIPAGGEVQFRVLPRQLGLWALITQQPAAALDGGARMPGALERVLEEAAYLELLQKEPNLYLMPYRLDIE
jgi:protease-4